jgi:hypothetical protein
MERMVVNTMKQFLEENKLLSEVQHGFRNNYSCITNLLAAMDDWTNAMDHGHCVHVCYLDMAKAFDRVDHELLLSKLQKYGISGKLLEWLRDYLDDRSMHVRVDGSLSKRISAPSGVPQGSVLGPILFLLYVDDIPKLVRCRINLFADDIKIWSEIRNVDDCLLLQRDLDNLYDWSVRNRLPFNLKKCTMLQLGKCFEFTYHMGPAVLVWTQKERDLGVWITSNLKSSIHCQIIYKKACNVLGMLRRLFGRLTPKSLPILLNTYIRPVMEYAVQAWSPWLSKDIELMQRIYHRATKLVDGFQHLDYTERLYRLNLFDFIYRRIRGDLILMYRIINTPDHPLTPLFKRQPHNTSRRHDQALAIPNSRLNCRRYFFAVRVCFAWNSLPHDIIHSSNLARFKRNLDEYMHTNTIIEPTHY